MKRNTLAALLVALPSLVAAFHSTNAQAQYLDSIRNTGTRKEANQLTEERKKDDQRYVEHLREITLLGLGVYAGGDLLTAVAACGADTVGLAVTAIAETLPILPLVTCLGHTMFGENYNERLNEASRGRGNKNGAGEGEAASFIFGAPIAILVSGAIESISNGWKLLMNRHPVGVDYSVTVQSIAGRSYEQTEDQFLVAFKDHNSFCRHSLWKIHQIAREMGRPKSGTTSAKPVASDGSAPKSVPKNVPMTADDSAPVTARRQSQVGAE